MEGRGSWFENLGVGVVCPKNSANLRANSTGLRVSSPKFLFNYIQIYLSISEISPLLGSVLISKSCALWDILIFFGDPTTPIPKSGVLPPTPSGLMPMHISVDRAYQCLPGLAKLNTKSALIFRDGRQ